jgi:hypothetical protein
VNTGAIICDDVLVFTVGMGKQSREKRTTEKGERRDMVKAWHRLVTPGVEGRWINGMMG